MITGKTRARYRLAHEAVRCFVEQTYRPRELLIINDGEESLDLEAENIREIRIARIPERTLGDLRNLALELAYGDWIIQWDDDDWYAPERIEKQMLASRPGAAVLLGDVINYSMHRNTAFKPDWPRTLGFLGSILHERSVSHRYPSLSREEDLAFRQQFRDVVVLRSETPLYIYRYHTQNTWEEQMIMGSLVGQHNQIELDGEDRRWLLWSLTPVPLRHLLAADGHDRSPALVAARNISASVGGFTFVVTVADEGTDQLAWCLNNIREWHPDASLIVISDGTAHPEYRAIVERYAGRYIEGERLKSLSKGAEWWERFFIEALNEDGNCILKVDPDTKICRTFCSAPYGEFFGTVRYAGTDNEHVQGGCMGFGRHFAEKVISSRIALCDCYKKAETWILCAECERFIRSRGPDYLSTDCLMMHMARSLGVKWHSWPEIGSY
jgi:Glycosyl transferase family 2